MRTRMRARMKARIKCLDAGSDGHDVGAATAAAGKVLLSNPVSCLQSRPPMVSRPPQAE